MLPAPSDLCRHQNLPGSCRDCHAAKVKHLRPEPPQDQIPGVVPVGDLIRTCRCSARYIDTPDGRQAHLVVFDHTPST
jgi:hypothetical protein